MDTETNNIVSLNSTIESSLQKYMSELSKKKSAAKKEIEQKSDNLFSSNRKLKGIKRWICIFVDNFPKKNMTSSDGRKFETQNFSAILGHVGTTGLPQEDIIEGFVNLAFSKKEEEAKKDQSSAPMKTISISANGKLPVKTTEENNEDIDMKNPNISSSVEIHQFRQIILQMGTQNIKKLETLNSGDVIIIEGIEAKAYVNKSKSKSISYSCSDLFKTSLTINDFLLYYPELTNQWFTKDVSTSITDSYKEENKEENINDYQEKTSLMVIRSSINSEQGTMNAVKKNQTFYSHIDAPDIARTYYEDKSKKTQPMLNFKATGSQVILNQENLQDPEKLIKNTEMFCVDFTGWKSNIKSTFLEDELWIDIGENLIKYQDFYSWGHHDKFNRDKAGPVNSGISEHFLFGIIWSSQILSINISEGIKKISIPITRKCAMECLNENENAKKRIEEVLPPIVWLKKNKENLGAYFNYPKAEYRIVTNSVVTDDDKEIMQSLTPEEGSKLAYYLLRKPDEKGNKMEEYGIDKSSVLKQINVKGRDENKIPTLRVHIIMIVNHQFTPEAVHEKKSKIKEFLTGISDEEQKQSNNESPKKKLPEISNTPFKRQHSDEDVGVHDMDENHNTQSNEEDYSHLHDIGIDVEEDHKKQPIEKKVVKQTMPSVKKLVSTAVTTQPSKAPNAKRPAATMKNIQAAKKVKENTDE